MLIHEMHYNCGLKYAIVAAFSASQKGGEKDLGPVSRKSRNFSGAFRVP